MLALTLFIAFSARAEDDLCEFFKYCPGRSSSRSSAKSLPSTGSAASLNPSNIAQVKGIGIESTFQSGNSPLFDVVTGTGKVGALVSPTQENTFFGNRPIEIDDVYLLRRENKKQYKNKKLSFALGANIVDKRNAALDVGVSVKRNPDLKKFNPGFAASGRVSFLTFGFYYTKDDVKIDLGNYINPYTSTAYSSLYSAPTYSEKFNMMTYTLGVQFGALAVDAGVIRTKYNFYNEETFIRLLSFAYSYKKFLFNFAQRIEDSANLYYDNRTLRIQRNKIEHYYGFQYLYNQHVLLGVAYNNFLLHELSGTLTLFF